MTNIDESNMRTILSNKENKFIYLYRGNTPDQNSAKVEEHAMKMENGLKVIPYRIDIDKHFSLLSAYLKERNPKTSE